jgi:diguanylate cyclase (GGDEF)-like protein/PAS domain S-box-containing protein
VVARSVGEQDNMTYPLVEDEAMRLEAVRALQIVDTPRTTAFDTIATLAADMFGCPIAFISLLEQDRQWFKAECGLGLSSTARSAAFCNYTIRGGEVFVVEDALRDERFANNPLVTGECGVRFYAGVPIKVTTGYRVGALCIADVRPRTLSALQIERLHQLGKLAEAAMEAHAQSVRATAAARDVAENAQLLWKRNRLLQQVERIGKIGGWELDLDTQIVTWSDEVSRIHGLPPGKPCGLEEALSHYPEQWRARVRSAIAETQRTGEPYDFEAEFVTASGQHKWVRAAGECEVRDDVPVRLFGMFQDITLEKKAAAALRKAADFDELTGLANRRRFNAELTGTIDKADTIENGIILMVLDLDNFKSINDTRGHGVGDLILAEIGRRLAHEACDDCFAARLGGDEFALILSGDQTDARIGDLARRLLTHIKQPVRVGPMHIEVGGTLGVARFPADARTSPELLKKADLALYSAKQSDRGTVSFYTPAMAELFELHSAAADLLRNAMAQARLVPFYQPKVRLDDGSCYGFEALARIVTEEGTTIGPAMFAPALADRALARRLGWRMLYAVTADIAAWRQAGLNPVSVSLNVCEGDFTDGKLARRILMRLDELGLAHTDLTIEVTESVFLGNGAKLVREALDLLDAAGVKVELDDFGTGYASLAHLRAFPVSRLKIDRSFIEGLERGDDSDVIVQAVIDLGHNLGCEIIAEGVETEALSQRLRNMGCDAAQGYLYGYPVSADRTARELAEAGEASRQGPRWARA